MGTKTNKSKNSRCRGKESATARVIAPEDVRCGSFVTIMSEIEEHVPVLFSDESQFRHADLVRLEHMHCAAGYPLHVTDVCVPFVFVKAPLGERFVLDMRRYRLARLPRTFAREVRDGLVKSMKKHRKG